MFFDPSIAGSWRALVTRLNSRDTVSRWAALEPALSGLTRVEQIQSVLGNGGDKDRSDAVLGALVRLAAADGGGNDEDALLLALHCMSPAVFGLANDLCDLSRDIVALIVGELTLQIRSYLRRGRTRAYAENLRLETRRAVLDELRPSVRHHPELGEDVTGDGDALRLVTGVQAGPDESDDEDVDVVDLLLWAVRSGADLDGVRLLVATERARAEATSEAAAGADGRVASAHGISERTLYRRRERTLTAVRLAAREYLAAAA
ncbi:hypothetical protein [Jatrophihabitans lederbergiae]|jgi:hypothetical protein|uniref:Sigma-70 family RNA polymerase sigma factor n=1 Tax=Jatrophihabitans lederbergiae TaxID=3075547 RepID=A0ABU2JBH9_9ACTN|nr:hypothetical protein [Jatrophihabitans sp. DSM 44399]MDT0262340.1 hypothetical protein [Jatrophihabitans sp. DSM 44399]